MTVPDQPEGGWGGSKLHADHPPEVGPIYMLITKPIQLGFGQGFDKDGIVADPLFVDPTKPQAGLRPESPAIKLGFKPIDMNTIGPAKGP